MSYLKAVCLFFAFFFPSLAVSLELPTFPNVIGAADKVPRMAEIKTWNPDTMYEHINGEAELLKRYGVKSLAFTYYENDQGDYLSVELFDMGRAINAYGLYRLYSACEDGEYQIAGATVLGGDYTSLVMRDHRFLRINAESSTAEDGRALVDSFLSQFAGDAALATPDAAMTVLAYLQEKADKPCEVQYHPEHLDYDLETGPGYAWVGPGGQNYFLSFLPSAPAAQQHVELLEQKGVPTVLTAGRTVLWQKETEPPKGEYAKEIIAEINSLLR